MSLLSRTYYNRAEKLNNYLMLILYLKKPNSLRTIQSLLQSRSLITSLRLED